MTQRADGLHETMVRDRPVSGSSDRSFGLVFAGFCAIVAAFSVWRGGERWPWWLAAALTFGVLALFAPKLLGPLNWLWTRFGLLLHRIINPLVMGIIFFGVVTPIGLLMRLCGKRTLALSRDIAVATYWISRSKTDDSMKRQF